ncbi:MAG TPA: alpha/beta hydrolase [Acidimicrobiales bacterium]|nr:MAG: alpha/beta hydrolase [Actinobacteria bacterium 21-73-9]HQU26563.1 alpha/beta hydrolase [Acidimicrobiales bacterium]
MADALLETAIANWQPRFVANGVDASDYVHIAARLERWEEWCATWCEAGADHEALGAAARAAGNERSAGEHLVRAAVYYHFAKFLFVHDLEQARAAHGRAVAALTDASPLLAPPATRLDIPFEGTRLVALLRTPDPVTPQPTVVLIPGLDSAKEEFREVERAFLDRGLATVSLEGPGQGEVEWELPIRPDWEVVGEVALGYLRTRPEVDPERIGVWGVSLGGYYAARIAAADLGVRATVALSGPYDFAAAWGSLNPLTRRAFVVRSASADEAEAARRAADLTLTGRASSIRAPLLVVQGRRDRLFSWREGERLVTDAAGPAELLVLDEGNHGCANVTYRHRPYAADWLARHLGAEPRPTPTPGAPHA